ncbi:MAG TPA: hypothetical protein VF136_17890, partial [Methylomirabilota bacterium]
MYARASILLPLLTLVALTGSAGALAPAGELPSPRELERIWASERLPQPPPLLLRHADVVASIERLQEVAPGFAGVETIGESVQGRSIHHLRVGRGPLG